MHVSLYTRTLGSALAPGSSDILEAGLAQSLPTDPATLAVGAMLVLAVVAVVYGNRQVSKGQEEPRPPENVDREPESEAPGATTSERE